MHCVCINMGINTFTPYNMHTIRGASVGWVAGAVCVCMRAQEPVQTQIGRGVVMKRLDEDGRAMARHHTAPRRALRRLWSH